MATTSQQAHNCQPGGPAACGHMLTGAQGRGARAGGHSSLPHPGGGRPCPCPGTPGRSAVWAPLLWHRCASSATQSRLTLRPCGLYSPWDSPGQSPGVGSLSLLQGIFPTQGLNPGLLHCRWILYRLTHQGSPRPSLTKPASSMSIRSQQSVH